MCTKKILIDTRLLLGSVFFSYNVSIKRSFKKMYIQGTYIVRGVLCSLITNNSQNTSTTHISDVTVLKIYLVSCSGLSSVEVRKLGQPGLV